MFLKTGTRSRSLPLVTHGRIALQSAICGAEVLQVLPVPLPKISGRLRRQCQHCAGSVLNMYRSKISIFKLKMFIDFSIFIFLNFFENWDRSRLGGKVRTTPGMKGQGLWRLLWGGCNWQRVTAVCGPTISIKIWKKSFLEIRHTLTSYRDTFSNPEGEIQRSSISMQTELQNPGIRRLGLKHFPKVIQRQRPKISGRLRRP